ncbi:hypothetical protein ACS0TY_035374 [Phlomoides rotata]
MNTVVSLPEKRHDLGQELFPDPPPEKRAKLTGPKFKRHFQMRRTLFHLSNNHKPQTYWIAEW